MAIYDPLKAIVEAVREETAGQGFLKNINELRPADPPGGSGSSFVDWNKNFLWDIKFHNRYDIQHKSKLQGKFADWFPAVDVNLDMAFLDVERINLYLLEDYRFPSSSKLRSMGITFHDDERGSIVEWLRTWINDDILNQGKHVSVLEEAVKLVQIAKLNSQRKMIKTFNYWVIPEGLIPDYFGSNSETNSYTVTFSIVGETDTTVAFL